MSSAGRRRQAESRWGRPPARSSAANLTCSSGGEYHRHVAKISGAILAFALIALPAARVFLYAQVSQAAYEDRIAAELSSGQLEDAITDARRAAAQYPGSSTIQQMLGAGLFKSGQKGEARVAFRRAIELDPKIPDNYYDLALLELSDNRLADAAQVLEKYLTLKPGNAQAHLLLGRAEHNLNETIPAIAQFKKALELAPDLPLAHYHLGFAYQSQGDLKAALEEFKKEIENNPTFYESYWLAGNIELEQGNLDGAAELFRRAQALRSGGFEGHYGLARVLMAQKKWAEAKVELQKAVAIQPNNIEAHYALARTYAALGEKDDAAREFKIVADLHARERSTGSGIAGQRH
jgi:tetratricopeptide (TPR) repeat protein